MLSNNSTSLLTIKEDEIYPTSNTTKMTITKPKPGILFRLPSGSSSIKRGNKRCIKLGRMLSIQLKRETTAQMVMVMGARMMRPCKKYLNNLPGTDRSFMDWLFRYQI